MVVKARAKEFLNITPEDEDIPDTLRYTSRGELFVIHDSGVRDPERCVILCSTRQLGYLKKSSTWLIDGTFRSAPSVFTQLITIHGLVVAKTYPLAFILLRTKKETAYCKPLEFLKNQLEQYQPVTIISDFEKALINSCKTIFSRSKIAGCAFHFGQANWRKIQQLGLIRDYKTKCIIYEIYQKCLNLTFFSRKPSGHNF